MDENRAMPGFQLASMKFILGTPYKSLRDYPEPILTTFEWYGASIKESRRLSGILNTCPVLKFREFVVPGYGAGKN